MPVARVQGGGVYYLAQDQVRSLRAVYTAAGDVVRTVEYDAWGVILDEDVAPGYEGLKAPFGFAGGLHDRDTGLVLFGLRNYDPETGRWTSRDPIGLAGGDTDLYAYCGNDPVNAVDPSGLLAWYDRAINTAANMSAGFGDAMTFGITGLVRDAGGLSDYVDDSSGAYLAGEVAGTLYGMALEGGAGAAAGAKIGTRIGTKRAAQQGLVKGTWRSNPAFPRGKEWIESSHFIPKRYGKPSWVPNSVREFVVNSPANQKLMWGIDHALNDPSRFRFLKKGFRDAYTRNDELTSLWNRLPDGITGATIGFLLGAGTGIASPIVASKIR